jgi:DnaJ-class molecular chaperone
MQEYYKFLGVSAFASDEEITERYNELKKQFSNDRFLEGEAGNIAAKNLTKLETAYKEIMDSRNQSFSDSDNANSFAEIENLIREGKLNEAQAKLDVFSSRSAEWHYIQSVVFYKKNWSNESKKQLEIAMEMEPNNQKYSTAYQKLKTKLENNEKSFNSNSSNYGQDGNPETDRQMGSSNDCMRFCATWCCIDMMCSICCR